MSHQPGSNPSLPVVRGLLTAALRNWERVYPASRGLLVAEADADLRSVKLNLEAALLELGDA